MDLREDRSKLLDFDGAASGSDLGLDFFGFRLVDGFLDRLRSGFHQRLGFGQTQRGDGADFLDDGNLVAAVTGQDDVEFGLLFSSRRSSASSRCRNSDSSSSRNAPLFFKQLRKFSRLHDGQGGKVFYNLVQISHFKSQNFNSSPLRRQGPLGSRRGPCLRRGGVKKLRSFLGGICAKDAGQLASLSLNDLNDLCRRCLYKAHDLGAQFIQ